MKKYFITAIFSLGFLTLSMNLKAQDLNGLKQQMEVLKLNTELMNKKIVREAEKENNDKIQKEVNNLNRKSDKITDKFVTSDPKSTERDAANTSKVLKKAEKANKDLHKSNGKINSLNSDINKIEAKLNKLPYSIEFKGK